MKKSRKQKSEKKQETGRKQNKTERKQETGK